MVIELISIELQLAEKINHEKNVYHFGNTTR